MLHRVERVTHSERHLKRDPKEGREPTGNRAFQTKGKCKGREVGTN